MWEKEKNAGNQHFLHFPQCFQPCHGEVSSFWPPLIKKNVICRLQMLSIRTSLEFCRSVKSYIIKVYLKAKRIIRWNGPLSLRKFTNSQQFWPRPIFVDFASLLGSIHFANTLTVYYTTPSFNSVNPLPHMPILASSSSAANKDMMSKLLTNGDTIFWLSRKHCWKRQNCLLWAFFFFLFLSCFEKLSVVDALKWVSVE